MLCRNSKKCDTYEPARFLFPERLNGELNYMHSVGEYVNGLVRRQFAWPGLSGERIHIMSASLGVLSWTIHKGITN